MATKTNTHSPFNFLSLTANLFFTSCFLFSPCCFLCLSVCLSLGFLCLSLSPYLFFVLPMWCYQPSSFCYQGHLLDPLQLSVAIWNPLWKKLKKQNKWWHWEMPFSLSLSLFLSILFSILLLVCPFFSPAYKLAGLSTLPRKINLQKQTTQFEPCRDICLSYNWSQYTDWFLHPCGTQVPSLALEADRCGLYKPAPSFLFLPL